MDRSIQFLTVGTLVALALACASLSAAETASSAPAATSDNSELYYAAKATFSEPKSWELRLGGGYDLSNPYLNIFSAQASAFYLSSPEFAWGLEGTMYFSQERSNTTALEQELSAYGYDVVPLDPQASVVALFRVTPLSGLVNFFSSSILSADISVIARAGAVQYRAVGAGPLMGLALETHVGITPSFGIHSSVQWDLEKPGPNPWQWRSGFRIGPSLKF